MGNKQTIKLRKEKSFGESSATNFEDEWLGVKVNHIVAHSICDVNNCLLGKVNKDFFKM